MNRKKGIALLLAVLMVVALLPTFALGQDILDWTDKLSIENGKVSVTGNGAYLVRQDTSPYVIKPDTVQYAVKGEGGWKENNDTNI